jgi:hypothetical protein
VKNLTDTMILWDRKTGEVALAAWPPPLPVGEHLPSSWGACDTSVSEASEFTRGAMLFVHFAHMVVRDKIDPAKLNELFLNLDEWRHCCAYDMPHSSHARAIRGEPEPDIF